MYRNRSFIVRPSADGHNKAAIRFSWRRRYVFFFFLPSFSWRRNLFFFFGVFFFPPSFSNAFLGPVRILRAALIATPNKRIAAKSVPNHFRTLFTYTYHRTIRIMKIQEPVFGLAGARGGRPLCRAQFHLMQSYVCTRTLRRL